ncbi:MAG: hypothetical protein ACLGIN_17735, partial [Candidatus Sericytochromatia bacterium]
MKKWSLPLAMMLGASAVLAGCGAPGAMPLFGQVNAGKFKAQSLHSAKNRFSKHHLVVKMAPGATSPVPGVKVREGVEGYAIHQLPTKMRLAEAIALYEQHPSVQSIQKLELYPLE